MHSSMTDFLLAQSIISREPIFHIVGGFTSLSMPNSPFLNFKKFQFSHQVALVGKDYFTFKSFILFAMTICLNIDVTFIRIYFWCIFHIYCNNDDCYFCMYLTQWKIYSCNGIEQ